MKVQLFKGGKAEIHILGSKWQIIEDDEFRIADADGFTDNSVREIHLRSIFSDEKSSVADMEEYKRRVLRHEILHAFIFECGLDTENSWARNEEMVEFFALQFDKILTLFSTVKVKHLDTKIDELKDSADGIFCCCMGESSNDN